MQINWTPVRRDETLSIEKAGDALTINGETYDFAPLPDGATLPRAAVACDWLASDVERIGGEIHLTLVLPHGCNAPDQTRFPQPVEMIGDGPVPVPPQNASEAIQEEEPAA
jgi:hypothetical protein